MKTGYWLFNGLAAFYAIITVIYWLLGGEAVGITAMGAGPYAVDRRL